VAIFGARGDWGTGVIKLKLQETGTDSKVKNEKGGIVKTKLTFLVKK